MSTGAMTISSLVGIRAAHHPEATPGYDRLVFDFEGPVPLIQVEYVKRLLGDGSGLPIPIAGRAILHVSFSAAQAHSDAGEPTAPSRVAFKLPVLREVVRAGDFEAVVSYGVGLSKKADLRVITLADRSRVVIDVFQ